MAAREPEVADLIVMLGKMGRRFLAMELRRCGIRAVEKLHGRSTVIPDRIEAGRFSSRGQLPAGI